MPHDTRLSRMLHVLIHMDREGGRTSSKTISLMLNTNPVVVRRTMAGLRDRGYVVSIEGYKGGWELARNLNEISVLDIHLSLGRGQVFAIGLSEGHPCCPVERIVNARIAKTLAEAEASLLANMDKISLEDIAKDLESSSTSMSIGPLVACGSGPLP